MDPELLELFREVRTEVQGDNENSYTHITHFGPEARWTVQPSKYREFWQSYCDLVDRQKIGELCVAERAIDVMPVIGEIILRFDDEMTDEPYSDDLFYSLAFCYQQAMLELFQISDARPELLCCCLESENWQDGDETLVKIRIQFPYCRIDATTQIKLLRPKVIQLLRKHNIVSRFAQQPVGDWEQNICLNTVTNPLLMYGSEVAPGRPKMELKHIIPEVPLGIVTGEIDIEEMEELEINRAFDPRNHTYVSMGLLNASMFSEYDQHHWIPLFLSIYFWPTVTLPKPVDIPKKAETVTTIRFGANHFAEDSDLDIADRMLTLINPARFLEENFWLDIGRALYSSDDGGEVGLNTWIKYTEKNSKRTEEDCRSHYNTFINTRITVRTLAWYAREDNKDRYNEWHSRWCNSSMEKALSAAHSDVALALYRFYWLDYICCCCSGNKVRWFQFRKYRWIEAEQGIALRKKISDEFMKKFETLRTNLSQQIQKSNDDGFRVNGELAIKKITALIHKLKTHGYKTSIHKEAIEQFDEPKLIETMDSNPDTLGILNGVIEIVGGSAVFRSGKPEDYITRCAPVPFTKDFTWNHPSVVKVMKYLGQIFTDKDLCHHFLKFSASCLKGRNSDKIFPIFTGDGNNSKSMIIKLFEATLGNYCIKFPTSLLTGKRANSSGPTPELARSRATRLAFLQETDSEDTMKGGQIKELTGGDSFFARLLNENGGDIQATFKLVLACNKPPTIPNADRAIKNRTKIFPFFSTWVDDPPESEEEQYAQKKFKNDPFFEKTLPLMAPAFLWIMFQYYPIYIKEGLSDPESVKQATEKYWEENDPYYQFTTDTIDEARTPNGERDIAAKITLSEIYSEYKFWFKDNFPGIKVPERAVVRTELATRWGKLVNNHWTGIRLKERGPANIGGKDMTGLLTRA